MDIVISVVSLVRICVDVDLVVWFSMKDVMFVFFKMLVVLMEWEVSVGYGFGMFIVFIEVW